MVGLHRLKTVCPSHKQDSSILLYCVNERMVGFKPADSCHFSFSEHGAYKRNHNVKHKRYFVLRLLASANGFFQVSSPAHDWKQIKRSIRCTDLNGFIRNDWKKSSFGKRMLVRFCLSYAYTYMTILSNVLKLLFVFNATARAKKWKRKGRLWACML